jgi:hypothetical protein
LENKPLDRRFILLIAALSAAPLPALAQVWPAGAAVSVMSVRTPVPQTRTFTVIEREALASAPTSQPRVLKIKARSALDSDAPPPVDIRAKAEWSDDQGFRASPTKVSYKLRF